MQLSITSACLVKVLTFEERFIIFPAECAVQNKGNNELYLHALAESPSGRKKGWSFSKGYPARVIFGLYRLYRFFWLTHRSKNSNIGEGKVARFFLFFGPKIFSRSDWLPGMDDVIRSKKFKTNVLVSVFLA